MHLSILSSFPRLRFNGAGCENLPDGRFLMPGFHFPNSLCRPVIEASSSHSVLYVGKQLGGRLSSVLCLRILKIINHTHFASRITASSTKGGITHILLSIDLRVRPHKKLTTLKLPYVSGPYVCPPSLNISQDASATLAGEVEPSAPTQEGPAVLMCLYSFVFFTHLTLQSQSQPTNNERDDANLANLAAVVDELQGTAPESNTRCDETNLIVACFFTFYSSIVTNYLALQAFASAMRHRAPTSGTCAQS